MKDITRRVNDLFEKSEGTKADFCRKTGVKWSTLGSNLSGENKWGLDTIMKLAEYFKVTTDFLAFGNENIIFEKLQKENSLLKLTVNKQDEQITLLQNFILEYLETKNRTTGKTESPLIKGVDKLKGKKD